jgi:septal ring factor EnvC (AmiA/AmiB activator)
VTDNSRFLAHAANERHRHSVERVLAVLQRFDRDGLPVSFVSVAEAASVSRSWLYRERSLRPEIARRRGAAPTPPKPLVPAAQRASAESQRRKVEALNGEIKCLREDNARLRTQLERSLGEQRLTTATRGPIATIPRVRDMSPTQTT